ncbi:MAG: 50S ribosomal protein L19 [Candidatus Levybacteria bacterium RBG_16_35_11]|nr:MAG: 50S ribosomal protein L19 [Candidatus Levybacteria bacterium RBG_16_35_11]
MVNQINFVPGDIVRVHQKIKEIDTSSKGGGKEKTRIQIFQGVVLNIRGRGGNKTFTVRKMVEDIAAERIFPFNSPNIQKIDVTGHLKNKVRRAKLSYLRKSK